MHCRKDNKRLLHCLITAIGPQTLPLPLVSVWILSPYEWLSSSFLVFFITAPIDWVYINGESNNSRGLPTKRTTSGIPTLYITHWWGLGSWSGYKVDLDVLSYNFVVLLEVCSWIDRTVKHMNQGKGFPSQISSIGSRHSPYSWRKGSRFGKKLGYHHDYHP